MALPKYPDVNGVRTSYCSIELGIDGLKLKGVTSINYREPGEIGKLRGTSPHPIGRTRGQVTPEGDIEMYRAEWDELLKKLTKNGTFGYMELSWPVTVAYAEEISPETTVTDTLEGVRFLSPEVSNAEGTDAVKVKVTLDIMGILWNGKYRSLRK